MKMAIFWKIFKNCLWSS